MITHKTDIVVVGAGPVGLLCAYLGYLCGIDMIIIDKSEGPLEVGRADALNARTLQLLEIVDLFSELYKLGKTCNTSSVWAEGQFISRQSSWWQELEGCLHKHFLMLGQSFIEKTLDDKLKNFGAGVKRSTSVEDIQIRAESCRTYLSNGEVIESEFIIGADGSRSFVRDHFKIPFEITRPQLIWAVIDGIIETDFLKVPEIISFQTDTSDVAWIPREGNLDRFYVRMDSKDFTIEEVILKIKRAMKPYTLSFKEVTWFSQFSVKESVAEKYVVNDKIFLVGDASHIHSVNGGQGLNTGLADAFNLIWKLNMVLKFKAPLKLLDTYETERKPVAISVVEASGELVRSTKFSATGTHALDYVKIVKKRAGNITGMGIRYGNEGLTGSRLYDFEILKGDRPFRVYSLLDYSYYTLLVFSDDEIDILVPSFVKIIQIYKEKSLNNYWTESTYYSGKIILVRPDSYIEAEESKNNIETRFKDYL